LTTDESRRLIDQTMCMLLIDTGHHLRPRPT